jgi:WD40 repeat protein
MANEGAELTPQHPDAPPLEPILRLETTAHTARIDRIATDRENRYAITASMDKTARVWSLPDGRPLTVLRVPIGEGHMGELYAAAMTPDGSAVALGGWTAIPGQSNHWIYLFDRASGTTRRRVSGLPNQVNHLAYSADGNVLVAALGSKGIRVYHAGCEYEPLPSDTAYGGASNWADFDRQRRLVTTSDDGFIRLYAPGRYDAPTAKAKGRRGSRPFSAVFSPDGQRVAIGYADSTAVDLLSGRDLAFVQAADTGCVSGRDLAVVNWSADGRYLFAGGAANERMVRRWENSGTGGHIDIVTANNTVMQLLPLKHGGMLFATADPAFGIIDAHGSATILQRPGQLDFRNFGNRQASLRVSKAGKTVEKGTNFPQHTIRYAFAERRLDVDPSPDDTLAAPVTEGTGLTITGWKNGYRPSVNGQRIALQSYESSRSLSILPNGDGFVLGTDWSVCRVDRDGKLVWRSKPLPGEAWEVNVAPDGRLVVSAHHDGTIRWRRLCDGEELLALFVHPEGKRWIAWTPQGYYDASVGADELIGWHVNRGFDEAADFFLVSQFRDRFYRADVIAKVLDTLDVDEAVRQADEDAAEALEGIDPDTDEEQRQAVIAGQSTAKAVTIAETLPPVVEIADPTGPATLRETRLRVVYSARTPSGDPVKRVEARIDSRKTDIQERVLSANNDSRIGIITIEVPRRNAVVSIIAHNEHGVSEPASVQIDWAGPGSEPKPKLYILPIGVSIYNETRLTLRFPAKDANDFVNAVSDRAAGIYEGVITCPRPSAAAWTHDAVLEGLDWISTQPTNKDVAMVFLSGHGVVGADQVYRFLPCDFNEDKLRRTTVRSFEFQDFLSNIGGKVLVFLDTCYSGDVLRGKSSTQASLDKFANELSTAQNGAVVFASSTGNQLSWEDPEWGNGAFTKALVEGLRGAADRARAGVVRVAALEDYIYERVKELTHGKQKPMVAKPKMVENFPIVAVTD